MSKRILIPYLSAGLGHLVQAQAIAYFLRRSRPDWKVILMDAARDLEDELLQRTFVDLWRVLLRMPSPVSRALFGVERLAPGLVRAMNHRSFRTSVPKARRYLEEHPVDLIMSTHWACTHLFAMARGAQALPLYYVYGELATTYSVARCGADHYFTLSAEVTDGLLRLGIPRTAILEVPVIVDPAMVESSAPRAVLRRGLGIPPESLAVVLSLGGEGIGRTIPFITAFARRATGATLVVLTGKNQKLLQEIRRRLSSPAVIPLGYQEDLSPVVASADVLAGKCGTGFTSMAIATGLPLIVTHLGAPNERGNLRYLQQRGGGWYCPRPRWFLRKVMELAASGHRSSAVEPSGCAGSATGVSRRPATASPPPNGAQTIAAAIVEALA